MTPPRSSRRIVSLLALATACLGAAACHGGDTAPQKAGPVTFAVVSGNGQRVTAHRDSLSAPLVGQLVRAASGAVSFHVESAGERALALLLPVKAYAQTVVSGSPIVGAVVCAEPVSANSLTPFSRCTNTDATGHATFFFRAGSVAGVAKAAINGDTTTATGVKVPVTFDTARATVLPDTAANIYLFPTPTHADTPNDLGTVVAGTSVDLTKFVQRVEDRWGNAVPDWAGSAAFSPDSVDIHKPLPAPPPFVPLVGHSVVVPPSARTLYLKVGLGLQWFTLRTTV